MESAVMDFSKALGFMLDPVAIQNMAILYTQKRLTKPQRRKAKSIKRRLRARCPKGIYKSLFAKSPYREYLIQETGQSIFK